MNRSLTLVYVLMQVALTFALMALGWGNLTLLNEPPVLGTLVCVVLGSFTILHTGVELGNLKDPGERWGLSATLLLSLCFFYFLPLADRRSWFIIVPDGPVRYTGLLLFGIGTGLRTMGFLARREQMSITGLFPLMDEESFTERSIYLRTRHPQYLGLILQFLGFPLVFRSWLGVVAGLGLIFPVAARVEAEERVLRGRLGERYQDYMERTWRFIPGIY